MGMVKRLSWCLAMSMTMGLGSAGQADGQALASEIVLAVGNSAVVPAQGPLETVSIGAEDVATVAVPESQNEVIVNGIAPGSTTLILWTAGGIRTTYTIRVTLDAPSLERQLRQLFPAETIDVTGFGNTLILMTLSHHATPRGATITTPTSDATVERTDPDTATNVVSFAACRSADSRLYCG